MISQQLYLAFFLEYLASIWITKTLAGIVISVKILGLKFLPCLADSKRWGNAALQAPQLAVWCKSHVMPVFRALWLRLRNY